MVYAFARLNSSHYAITVIEPEGCTDGLQRSPVSDPFTPPVAIATGQTGAARQKLCWISSKTSAGLSTISVMPSQPEPAQSAAASSQTCFSFFFFFNLSHLNTCSVKLKRLLRASGTGLLEQAKRLSKASLKVRNEFSLQGLGVCRGSGQCRTTELFLLVCRVKSSVYFLRKYGN